MMADESHFRNKLLRNRNIMEYQIISDGSCDLDIDTLKKYDIIDQVNEQQWGIAKW